MEAKIIFVLLAVLCVQGISTVNGYDDPIVYNGENLYEKKLTSFAYEEPVPNSKCPLNENPENPTHLPYPGDCTKFYKCLGGLAYPMSCPAPLHWSIDMNRCEWPGTAKCIASTVQRLNAIPMTVNSVNKNYKEISLEDGERNSMNSAQLNLTQLNLENSTEISVNNSVNSENSTQTNLNKQPNNSSQWDQNNSTQWDSNNSSQWNHHNSTEWNSDNSTQWDSNNSTQWNNHNSTEWNSDNSTQWNQKNSTQWNSDESTQWDQNNSTQWESNNSTQWNQHNSTEWNSDNSTQWNRNNSTQWNNNSTESNQNNSTSSQTKTCARGGDFLPHPSNCNAFIRCNHFDDIVMFCPPDLHFNPTLKTCDFPYRAGCNSSTDAVAPKPRALSPVPIAIEPELPFPHPGCPVEENPEFPTHLAHKTSCSKFYKCLHGYAYVHDCPPTLEWSIEFDRCDWPEVANCKPKNPDYKPNESEQEMPAIHSECPITDDPHLPVHVPHPNCAKFYKCVNGIGHPLDCPPNQHFSAELNRCDWPEVAKCNAKESISGETPILEEDAWYGEEYPITHESPILEEEARYGREYPITHESPILEEEARYGREYPITHESPILDEEREYGVEYSPSNQNYVEWVERWAM